MYLRCCAALAALVACSPDPVTYPPGPPPHQIRSGVIIDPAGSGLEEEIWAVVEWYKGMGYEVAMGSPGIPVYWEVPAAKYSLAAWIRWAEDDLAHNSEFRLNPNFDWWLGTDLEGCDDARFFAVGVLRHEIGHVLFGSEHSPDPENVMFAEIGTCEIKDRL